MLRHSIIFTLLLFYFNLSLSAQVKILFDATKAQSAANADWVIDADKYNVGFGSGIATIGGTGTEANPQRIPTPLQSGITVSTPENYWSGALSAWGIECVKKGYAVETLPIGGKITYGDVSNVQDLSQYQVVVFCEPNIAFTATEKTAIIKYVENGGSLFLVGNHDMSDRNFDGIDSPSILNDLMNNNSVKSNPFGFNYNLENISQTSSNVISTTNHPILNGPFGNVTRLKTSGGSSMTINTTANPKVQGLVYKNNTVKLKTELLAIASQYAKGKVFAIADSSLPDDGTGDNNDNLYDGWLSDADGNHRKLIMNATVWLASAELDSIKATVKSIVNTSCSDSKDGTIELSVSGGNKIYSYLWSDGQTTNPINSLSTGLYTVTINSTGVAPLVLQGITISSPPKLVAGAIPVLQLNCKSTSVSLVANAGGGTPPYVFQWSSGDNKISAPGTYTLTVTDQKGCKATAVSIVTQDINLPNVVLQSGNISCAKPTAQLGASSLNTNLRYNWRGPQNFNCTRKDTVVALPGTYTLIAIDTMNGCSIEKTVTIIENNGNPPLEAKVIDKRDASDIPNGFITVSAKNGTPPYQYQWKDEKGNIVGTNSATLSNIDNGTYTCKITDANACQISISQAISKVLTTADPLNSELFTISPNPAADYIFIPAESALQFDIFSLTGQKTATGKTNERCEIRDIPAGLYMVKIYSLHTTIRYFIKI